MNFTCSEQARPLIGTASVDEVAQKCSLTVSRECKVMFHYDVINDNLKISPLRRVAI